ncbi:MAG: hypothetical protein ACLP8S_16550 [Solirubrobacteraceae bacterium]
MNSARERTALHVLAAVHCQQVLADARCSQGNGSTTVNVMADHHRQPAAAPTRSRAPRTCPPYDLGVDHAVRVLEPIDAISAATVTYTGPPATVSQTGSATRSSRPATT